MLLSEASTAGMKLSNRKTKKLPIGGGGLSEKVAALDGVGKHLKGVVKPVVKKEGWQKVPSLHRSPTLSLTHSLSHSLTLSLPHRPTLLGTDTTAWNRIDFHLVHFFHTAILHLNPSSLAHLQVSKADRDLVDHLWDLGNKDGDTSVRRQAWKVLRSFAESSVQGAP